ncbi:MAG: hypothetical protein GX187_01535 [Clostridiaceae bacterium]|nr:hypothetical protein [Clostridiaceae bacterium]
MFDQMISWGELITVVLFILGSALLFYLILAISNILKVIRNINQILETNKDNIQKSIEKLPEITDNTAKITGMVKDNIESIQDVVKDVGKISETVRDGVETIQKDILLKVKSILDIIDTIRKYFEKRKEISKKKKKGAGTVYRYKYKPDQDKPDEVEIVTTEGQDEIPYEEYVEIKSEGKPDDSDSTEKTDVRPEDAKTRDTSNNIENIKNDTSTTEEG